MSSAVSLAIPIGAGVVAIICLVSSFGLMGKGGMTTVGGLLLLLISIGMALLAVSMLLGRTVLDGAGVHVRTLFRRADYPWPTNRTSFFIQIQQSGHTSFGNAAAIVLVAPDGRPVVLPGLRWAGGLPIQLEERGFHEVNRIWAWAMAKGYARQDGPYIRLVGVIPNEQSDRVSQEVRFGLLPPL